MFVMQQLKEREFFLKMQKKKAALKPEDKVLQDAWDELEELKTNYTETKWHIDKMKKKIHARNDIYAVYDKCAGVSVSTMIVSGGLYKGGILS